MSLLTTIRSAHSGLKAASVAIEATAHNVANVSTTGFHKRSVELGVADGVTRGGISAGQGVKVLRVRRATDDLLGVRMIEQKGIAGSTAATAFALDRIESYFNEAEGTGFAQALDEFFDSLTRATSDPSDTGLRNAVVRRGEIFANTINRTADALSRSDSDIQSDINDTIELVNDLAKELAAVNESLVSALDTLGAGDFLDKRDIIVGQLADLVGSTVDYESINSTATVFVGGHALVSGTSARSLFQGTDAAGNPTVEMTTDSGSVVVTPNLAGRMGGLEKARIHIVSYLEQMNTFAGDFADAMNTQHQLGFDLNGTAGGAMFTFAAASEAQSLAFDAAVLADPNLLAYSGSATGGVANDENLKLLIDIQEQNLFNGGTKTTAEFASSLISEVGSDIFKYKGLSAAQGEHLSDLEGMMQALTGVSLDQEATNLIEFQAAYQAAAKVLRIADALIKYLLETLG
jgi:flagellar hook-associated protein 1 FlgK